MAIKLMDLIETAGDFPVINAPSVGLPDGKRLDNLLESAVILADANVTDFAFSEEFGSYFAQSAPEALGLGPITPGKKYLICWDGEEYEETAVAAELPGLGTFTAMGNGAAYGLSESDAPFLIAVNEVGVGFFSGADTAASHTVGIKVAEAKIKGSYIPEEQAPTGIDLTQYEGNGKIVEYFADGRTRTCTVERNGDGKPVKVTHSDGSTTVLTW